MVSLTDVVLGCEVVPMLCDLLLQSVVVCFDVYMGSFGCFCCLYQPVGLSVLDSCVARGCVGWMVGSCLGSVTGSLPCAEFCIGCICLALDVLQGGFEIFKLFGIDVTFVVSGDV